MILASAVLAGWLMGLMSWLAGVFLGQGATLRDFLHFLGLATVGNAAGGVLFVALIKYGHASRGSS